MRIPNAIRVLGFLAVLGESALAEEKGGSKAPEAALNQEGERYKSFETFAKALYYLETMYVDEAKAKADVLIEEALKGAISSLDPHTILMPKKDFEQLTMDTRGKFDGVGIIVSEERGKLRVVSPIEGTPAAKAGIKSGDEILAIDGEPIASFKGGDPSEKMRGPLGSKVKLSIKRGEQTMEFVLVREMIKVDSVRSELLAPQTLYVRIASFQENTAKELQKILEAHAKKLGGVIMDLRDNPGGLLDQAVGVVDLFIENGIIVSTVGRDPDKIEREFAHKAGTFSGFPMIVLINDGSASASEIVAGALQDHERAVIMGEQSFGKGSVQTVISLPDGSGLKLTIARYYTPKDRSIQAKGITPDILVPKSTQPVAEVRTRKEADLRGHIEGNDLSNIAAGDGIARKMEKWPKTWKDDKQLVAAFTYLEGWSKFGPK